MPDTFLEDTYKGYDICKIYVGEFKGEAQYLFLGLKKAQAVLENIDRIRKWVDQRENNHAASST